MLAVHLLKIFQEFHRMENNQDASIKMKIIINILLDKCKNIPPYCFFHVRYLKKKFKFSYTNNLQADHHQPKKVKVKEDVDYDKIKFNQNFR